MPEIEFIERLLMLFCFYVFLYPSMQQSFFAFLIGNCISIVRNFIFSGVRVTNPLHFKCFYCIQNQYYVPFLSHFFTVLVSKIVHYYNNLPISVCKCSFQRVENLCLDTQQYVYDINKSQPLPTAFDTEVPLFFAHLLWKNLLWNVRFKNMHEAIWTMVFSFNHTTNQMLRITF